MSTIKFRGKKNGSWIYGQYQEEEGHAFIIDNGNRHEVDANSVGKFTGIYDYQGNEIYVGDIIKMPASEFNAEIIGPVIIYNSQFVLKSRWSDAKWDLDYVFREVFPNTPTAEIIGNITDHPGLLQQFK